MAPNPHADEFEPPRDEPRAVDGYVAYEQPDEPVLKDPADAEALAMNLLSAATKARAQQMAGVETTPEPDFQDLGEPGDDQGDGQRDVAEYLTTDD